jgi:hypothetical protein
MTNFSDPPATSIPALSMNDEFEHRLSRHALRPVPPEVIEGLARAIRAEHARPEPRALRASAEAGDSAPVWRTLGLLWAGGLAMVCLSRSETAAIGPSSPRLTPEQTAVVRAERTALWELANGQESTPEPPSSEAQLSQPPERGERFRSSRPRSQLRVPSLPMLGSRNRAWIHASRDETPVRTNPAAKDLLLTITPPSTPLLHRHHAFPA